MRNMGNIYFFRVPKGKRQLRKCYFPFLARIRKHNKINIHGIKKCSTYTRRSSHMESPFQIRTSQTNNVYAAWKILQLLSELT